ncbi:hypothetical protein BJ138DRAFT_904656 [Hygrophoropsis aurantiaca]|uniref:Uncharacterized protein n=1 Tax=Hygrophoropsis aurantiaca TaxID=72124 RepID=A0ACB7ZUN2_9AGAM|nr:hypothetical protein BJ138DRAFT_904656 [Hygrophoropsis aurantiaca]
MTNNRKTCRTENTETIELTDSEPDSDVKVVVRSRPPSSRVKKPTYKVKAETTTTNPDALRLEKALEEALEAQKRAESEIRKVRKENRNLIALRDTQHVEIERLQDLVKKLLGRRDDKNQIKLEIKSEDAAKKEEVAKDEITAAESLEAKEDQQSDAAVQDDHEMGIPVDFDTEHDVTAQDSSIHYERHDLSPSGEGPDTGNNSMNHEHSATTPDPSTGSHIAHSVTPGQATISIKPEPADEDVKIAVTIKTEQAPDENAFVSFIKSEDGKFDIWNLDHLNLGPPLEIDRDLWVGFSRTVISDTFRGGRQSCMHHWQGAKAEKIPFVTFSRSLHSELPRSPGQHGVVFHSFYRFDDNTPITRPIDLFVGEGPNNWRYSGYYELGRRGEIPPPQLELLPPTVIRNWAKEMIRSKWGANWTQQANEEIAEKAEASGEIPNLVEFHEEGLRAALQDGRIVIEFTIMKCVGYRADWHEKLLHSQANPKPRPSTKRKRTGGKKGTPAKRVKGRSRKKLAKYSDSEESDEDNVDDEVDESEEDDEPEIKQRISARVGRRASRFISPEV